jgi:hypothetical protein
MAEKETNGGEQAPRSNEVMENTTLNFKFIFKAEGSLPSFSVTLDGKPLLNITYNRDVLLPLHSPKESQSVERLVNRFEGLLQEKITKAVTQLFIEALAGHKKQPASFFEMLSKLDDPKKRVGVKRGKEPKLSNAERDTLDARYDELHDFYKAWKRLHKDAHKLNGVGKSHDEWGAQWSEVIRAAAEPNMQVDLIERISDPDPYVSSPSEIAYTHLARECGYEVEYVKKVVGIARRSKKSSR